MKKTFLLVLVTAIILWASPYLVGIFQGGDDRIFTGFLINIPDANSYLAKMSIGWRGEWKFNLPYTAEIGDGAYIFLFYIILGHLSKLVGLSPIIMYHLVRLSSSVLMVWSLWRFCRWVFGEQWEKSSRYFLIIVFGSGMGWLFSPFLGMTSDLWVAEAYPFLSGFINPHFPLGICLILEVLMRAFLRQTVRSRILLLMMGLLISAIMPFGIVIVGVVLFGTGLWEWVLTKKAHLDAVLFPLAAGGLYLIYQYWSIQTDPILRDWNAQNLTPSPPAWDLIISFSPLLLLAIFAIWLKRHTKPDLPWRMTLVWLVLGLLMIYFPFSLQRRFLTGYFIPISLIGIAGLVNLADNAMVRRWIPVIVVASLLTNLLVWSSGWFGIISRNPNIYLSHDEQEALIWLDRNADAHSIIVAGPFMGMVIPTKTSLRVVYGHPYETTHASTKLEFINSLFEGKNDAEQDRTSVKEYKVKYIFWGEREAQLGMPAIIIDMPVIYENTTIKIYEVVP